MGKRLAGVVIGAAAVLAMPAVAMACSGGVLLDAGITYEERADVVFTGTAVRLETPWWASGLVVSGNDPIRWTFVVDGAVKGEVGERFTVVSARSDASCGVRFDLGQRYLVMAFDAGRGPEVTVGNGTEVMPPLDAPPPVEGAFSDPSVPLILLGAAGLAGTVGGLIRYRGRRRRRMGASAR